MSKTTSAWTLVAAFAAASAQAAPVTEELDRRADRRAQVNEQLRAVEVELYCDHSQQAMSMMREARRQLLAQRDEAAAGKVRGLEQAIWLVRHGDTAEAIATLESARAQG
ncbi:hypothetical protein [Roseateles amylovorans]|uniref:Uncharacterized protein n=1 Tax=Roseateles amylovorans TaxID=2978473 RepID=A0ABY6B9Y6_9BURK|nr:hypothetical protein [Roseateles amylovorans]UXH80721.1 hypothetical protein N4261_12925 [Roseateles amylovorans]